MRVYINGKLVEVNEGSKVKDLRKTGFINPSESLVEVKGARAEIVNDKVLVKNNVRYRSIPPVVQG